MTVDELEAVIAEQEAKLREITELNEELTKATHHGNGEVIRNWMRAYGKVMDQLEETEEQLRKAQVSIGQAYRAGYQAGATAGPDALDHVEVHLNKWLLEAMR